MTSIIYPTQEPLFKFIANKIMSKETTAVGSNLIPVKMFGKAFFIPTGSLFSAVSAIKKLINFLQEAPDNSNSTSFSVKDDRNYQIARFMVRLQYSERDTDELFAVVEPEVVNTISTQEYLNLIESHTGVLVDEKTLLETVITNLKVHGLGGDLLDVAIGEVMNQIKNNTSQV